MQEWNIEEHGHPDRRWSRYQIDCRVKIFAGLGPNKTVLYGRADDIGEGGLFLVAAIELKPNDVIDLEFTLPYSSDPLRLRGLVRNRQGYGYGVEFLNPSEAERQQLLRMCQVLSILR